MLRFLVVQFATKSCSVGLINANKFAIPASACPVAKFLRRNATAGETVVSLLAAKERCNIALMAKAIGREDLSAKRHATGRK